MCGIAGLIGWQQFGRDGIQACEQMLGTLVHRGPDASGLWHDDRCVILGHRRLSVIDLTEHGKQPMLSASGRYVIVFNGEIYNFVALRKELEASDRAPLWRGQSDTEVILACVEAWGFEATLRKLVGMFAFGLWDRERSILLLARDRIGEKPLYYGNVGGRFIFSSELKAIRAISLATLNIDREAISEFMRFGYVPAPRSIYQGVMKVPPGNFITMSAVTGEISEPVAYWQLFPPDIRLRRSHLISCEDNELIDALHDQLRDAVAAQMISDVPLGAFLSGGVDSSTIVALMQAQSERRIRTFTIGFNNRSFNEAPYARIVAEYLGTEHTELIVTSDDATNLIQQLPTIYDEPFADSSQIPTILVSRLTRSRVTVALSGDGADELFTGYPRYQLAAKLWQRINHHPLLVRRAVSSMMNKISAQGWDRFLQCVPLRMRGDVNGRRIALLTRLMACGSLGEMYVRLMSRWQPEDGLVIGVNWPSDLAREWRSGESDIDSMRLWDLRCYLPDDLMVKVDRAAMSASLETRAPFLDHRVVEFAMALPERVLVKDGVGKWALRRVLDRYVPRDLIDRPKAGFEVPLGDWLRGPLKLWAQSLLAPDKIRLQGYLNEKVIGKMWEQHQTGRYDRSLYLWNILMFQAWLSTEANYRS
ncbi:asparagine synthase (glutamine-hydrolyzing) OS=Castellaniella defragrans OX=75697 GN=HNR28_002301 PE=3 SV=1 [Castellaniella denitrificans]|uniref:asparagine synthase (glutamine-hydrolyzing) n=1 Tax=Castellaniella sp. TaxID=1955812 RepID=UPI003D0D72AB